LVLGGTKIKLPLVFSGIAGLIAIMFVIPWYTVSVNIFGSSVKASAGGFEVVNGTGLDFLHILLFFGPGLIAVFCAALVFFNEKVMELMGKLPIDLREKLHLVVGGLFACGLVLQIILMLGYASKVSRLTYGISTAGPAAGWVLALLLYLAAIGLSGFCFMKKR
jgi:hypothetical protein